MSYWLEISSYLFDGLKITVLLLLTTTILSVPLGMIGALIRVFVKIPLLQKIIDFYTWVMRGTPLMLQLFVVMFGFPLIGITLGRMEVAIITFALNYAAYYIEIFRGSLQVMDPGQLEAASVLHLPFGVTLRKVLLPQVFKRSLPTITNETITLLKDTALVSTIAIGELLRNAREIVSRDVRMEAFVISALSYLLLTYGLVKLFKRLETKWGYFH